MTKLHSTWLYLYFKWSNETVKFYTILSNPHFNLFILIFIFCLDIQSCHFIPCQILSYPVISVIFCHILWFSVISCYAISSSVVSCHILIFSVVSCQTVGGIGFCIFFNPFPFLLNYSLNGGNMSEQTSSLPLTETSEGNSKIENSVCCISNRARGCWTSNKGAVFALSIFSSQQLTNRIQTPENTGVEETFYFSFRLIFMILKFYKFWKRFYKLNEITK